MAKTLAKMGHHEELLLDKLRVFIYYTRFEKLGVGEFGGPVFALFLTIHAQGFLGYIAARNVYFFRFFRNAASGT